MIRSPLCTRRLASWALGLLALSCGASAQAALTSLEVTLRDPDNFPGLTFDPPGLNSPPDGLVDTVTPGAGSEIFAGNATRIGGSMISGSFLLFTNEYVDALPLATDKPDASCGVFGTSCKYRVVLGLESGVVDPNGNQLTGYGQTASYSFSNFVFSTPSALTALDVSSQGIVGLGALNTPDGQVSFDGNTIEVLIGNVILPSSAGCDGGGNCGRIFLDLTVQAVPEPGAFALLAAGLGLLLVATAHRRR